jgi:hypothetical protein
VYQGRGDGTGEGVWRSRLDREGGVVGAGSVDRVVCHTCRREKKRYRWMTHPKERLLSTDDDEREKR